MSHQKPVRCLGGPTSITSVIAAVADLMEVQSNDSLVFSVIKRMVK